MPDLNDFRERGDRPGEVWKLTGPNSLHTALQGERDDEAKAWADASRWQRFIYDLLHMPDRGPIYTTARRAKDLPSWQAVEAGIRVDAARDLTDLARAYENQRRPGYNHLMTQELAEAIEALLEER